MDERIIITNLLRRKLSDPKARKTTRRKLTDRPNTEGKIELNIPEGEHLHSIIKTEDEHDKIYVLGYNFNLDPLTNQLIFIRGRGPDDEVTITYTTTKAGQNWIYPARNDRRLSEEDYPIVTVSIVTETSTRLGNYKAPMGRQIGFEIDAWTKDTEVYEYRDDDTDITKKMTGDELALTISKNILKTFRMEEIELHPVLYGTQVTQGPTYIEFIDTTQTHRRTVGVNLWNVQSNR